MQNKIKSLKSLKSRNQPAQIRKRIASLRNQIRKQRRVEDLLNQELILREQLDRRGEP
jgi:hypothetical protein